MSEINIVRQYGDTYPERFRLGTIYNRKKDITGVVFEFVLAASVGGTAICSYTNGDGITIVDAEEGVITIDEPLDTTSELAPGTYYYELKGIFTDGRESIVTGSWTVEISTVDSSS